MNICHKCNGKLDGFTSDTTLQPCKCQFAGTALSFTGSTALVMENAALKQQLSAITAERDALKARIEEPVPITDAMAYSFHNAISDGALSANDVEEIKLGLSQAFANIPSPDTQELIRKAREEERARLTSEEGRYFPFEFEVWQDDEMVASASGPREEAMIEAMNYAAKYEQYGPVRVFEVTKQLVEPNAQTIAGIADAIRSRSTKGEV